MKYDVLQDASHSEMERTELELLELLEWQVASHSAMEWTQLEQLFSQVYQ